MTDLNINNLLLHINAINKKYENIEAITGEKFNIFKILKMESNEVKTHSAFLAELLKPNGSHGQKDAFLKLFISSFDIKNFDYKEPSDIEVCVEEFFENGRIDIVIKTRTGQVIVIENKIYAIDQSRQLCRYKEIYNDCHLIYLTLYGTNPSIESIQKKEGSKERLIKGVDFCTMSYKEDILNWLIQCRKEASSHPILRETLSQYINLIKSLTRQTMNDQQKEEVIKTVIYSPANIAAAEKIADSWKAIKYAIVDNFVKEIQLKYQNQGDVMFGSDEDCNIGDKETGFWFYKKNWKYCIYFIFGQDFEEMSIGIDVVNLKYEKNLVLKDYLRIGLASIAEGGNNQYFIWYTNFQEWNDYGWEEINNIIPKIQERTEKFITCIENLISTNIDFKNEWILKEINSEPTPYAQIVYS